MERTHPQLIAPSERAPVTDNDATPLSQQTVVLTKPASIELKWKANSWQTQYAQLLQRAVALKAHVEAHAATTRDLTQRRYGKKSEKSTCPDRAGESKPASARHRGHQPGSQGHGRSDRSALPVGDAIHDWNAAACCPSCGEAFAPFPGAEASSMIAMQVQAHVRRIQRLRDQKTCGCPHVPGIVTAPPAPRVIPKRPLGVSVWTRVLLDKDLSGRPTHRFCQALRHHGLPLAQGTFTEGLHRLAPLFEPVMAALYQRQRRAKLLHGDATRWEVFAAVDGKIGHRW